ncbi:ankyrin repeat and LEM domain-containing protein 1 [Octodon degus]|uniref:Ankyrin repeat and LEM domain-containing protein 1 n=1 Tax=Octodon degus TaxID=10160 RepID=A0A6P3FHS5_OCTDE|nr:ankyrin repeat and LEM domain-containing protein 1 [Octodon degus]
MWTPLRCGLVPSGTLRTVAGLRLGPGGGAARAHSASAASWKEAARRPGRRQDGDTGALAGEMGIAAGDTDTAVRLAWRLRAALVQEEPRAVEALLTCGADPNLVLEDGAAPLHLAARARGRLGLCCLGALLRRGGDPNARSSEALTPLHVAAAWGCSRGLELLLRHGADPALRDQDGLRPLDFAELQGHRECARILRGLRSPGCPTSAVTATGTHGDVLACPEVILQPTLWQVQSECGDMGLGPSSETVSSTEAAVEDGDSGSVLGGGDCSSDEASFVTVAEDPAPERDAVGAGSLSQAQLRPLGAALKPTGCLGLSGPEAKLCARLGAMALSPPRATFFPPLVDPDAAHSPSQEPSLCPLANEQLPCGGDTATLWLTEDEASTAEESKLMPTCKIQPVTSTPVRPTAGPTTPSLQLLCRFPALHYCTASSFSCQPLCGLPRLEEAWAGLDPDFSEYSPELAEALRTGCIPESQADEDALAQQFQQPNPSKRWREGVTKSSFTYLLLDPRETQDLPARASSLTPAQCLQTFVRAIFYVGKGTRSRPDVHLWEAVGYRGRPRRQACPKVRHILDIWDSGRGVVSLHCFQHVVAVEAYTREACLVDALGIQTLTNQKQGHYYGSVASWPAARRRRLGVHLLYRALLIFLAEGERELRPEDIQARG